MRERPLRVAVVGAGPAGLYAAGHLLEPPAGTLLDGRLVHLTDAPVEVDVFDKLPTPWGLVRGGVAPDHPEKKRVSLIFEAIADREGYRFFGNVEVGRDVTHRELASWYDAVIYSIGASSDPSMGIPGEQLPGSWAAREFVAWYNGHPDYSDLNFDLSGHRAVVVGNGNVALDVARILLTDPDELAKTDIADHALNALRSSSIREVMILGRRGHLQSAFNCPELEELGQTSGVDVLVETDGGSSDIGTLGGADPSTRRKAELLHAFASRPPAGHPRRVVLRFLSSPAELVGTDSGVEGALVVRNRLESDGEGRVHAYPFGTPELVETNLVLRAIGYFGTSIAGLPFDERRGVIPNVDGRIVGSDGPIAGAYVAGWIKRGPRGIIGTNKKCARDTVCALLRDAADGVLPTRETRDASAVAEVLQTRCPELVTQRQWRMIDREERGAGRLMGRPRQKMTAVDDMLALVATARAAAK